MGSRTASGGDWSPGLEVWSFQPPSLRKVEGLEIGLMIDHAFTMKLPEAPCSLGFRELSQS